MNTYLQRIKLVFILILTLLAVVGCSVQEAIPSDTLLSEEALIQKYLGLETTAVVAANGKIAFSSDADGDFDIYTMNPDGSGLANITNNLPGLHQSQPSWSPDGSKIAFTDGDPLAYYWQSNLWVINADGSNPTQLTFDTDPDGMGEMFTNREPDWSPDGTRILFTTAKEGDFDIYIINADGSNAHNMFVDEPLFEWGEFGAYEWDETDASWSPDGTKILYTASRPAGTRITTLDTTGVGPEQYLTPEDGGLSYYEEAEWSPDGQLIAYTNNAYFESVWVMNADGSNATEIAPENVVSPFSPEFSPDGTQLTMLGYPWGVLYADSELFSVSAPTAPLPAPTALMSNPQTTALTTTATRLTNTGKLDSADWQKKTVNTVALHAKNTSLKGAKGVITSQPAGISCGTQCKTEVAPGTKVTLTAKPEAGSKFLTWGGACKGKSLTCTVTVNKVHLAIGFFSK